MGHVQRQGQAVARTIVGERTPFTGAPFFWSQHYDIAINYVGHAEHWDARGTLSSTQTHPGIRVAAPAPPRSLCLAQGGAREYISVGGGGAGDPGDGEPEGLKGELDRPRDGRE